MGGAKPTQPLRRVGRCELFGEIDRGGMATVHLGRLVAVGGFAKVVAVKRMHAQFAKDPRFAAMFLDEARLVARIKHPNVLPTLDLIEEDGELFIVMEHVRGVSLRHLSNLVERRGERIPLPIALRVICGMLHGLHAAHEAKSPSGESLELVHRDVSPENILVGTDGVARLLDFGMARAVDRLAHTQAGEVKGKLTVMAPEQVQGGTVTRLTDVFASGVVLWQVLTGRRLIKGEHIAEVAHNVIHQEFEPPSAVVPELPKKLDAIVMRALERSPSARWPSADKMAAALEAIGSPASQREVGQWVERTAWQQLGERQKLMAEIEATPPTTGDVPPVLQERQGESSVSPMASSAAQPGPWSKRLPSSVGQALRAASRSLFERNAAGKLRLVASLEELTRRRPGVVLGSVAAFAVIIVASVVASSGDPPPSRALSGGLTPSLVPPPAPTQPTVAATLPEPVAVDGPMLVIPAGTFSLGCNTYADRACASDEVPREVRLGAFSIDRTEVTVSRYRECVEAGKCSREHVTSDGEPGALKPSDRCNYDREGRDRHPMNCVTYDEAVAFCAWAGGRLPTEAEWQRAAGGSDNWPFPSGDPSIDCDKAVMSEQGDGCGRGTTWPVGSKPAGRSAYGAFDMAGNVAEWVADWYSPTAYRDGPGDDPKGPAQGDLRVVRGGSWRDKAPALLRTSARGKHPPAARSMQIGFRCARSLETD